MLEAALAEQIEHIQRHDPCELCASTRDRVIVNTVGFDVLTEDTFSAAIERFGACGRSHVVHFLAAHPTVVARRVPAYRELLASGDLVVSDGAPIVVTMRAKGHPARRVTSTDGFLRVCSDGLACGTKHYFVGGASSTVARALRDNLRRSFPDIEIAGFEVPPFRPYADEEFAALVSAIRSSGAHVVWVGLGAPKQDALAHRLRAHGVAPSIVTIGATFDFVAGTKSRAPKVIRAVGLEWLFRLALEPRRLWRRYLLGNTGFLFGVLSDSIRRR